MSRELMGALVGLARALDDSNTDEQAFRQILTGLRAMDSSETEQSWVLAAVRAAKHRAVPDCSTCMNPCGRTADFDLQELESLCPALRAKKEQLMQTLITAAKRQKGTDLTDLPRYARGLFSLGYAWAEEEEIDKLISELGGH